MSVKEVAGREENGKRELEWGAKERGSVSVGETVSVFRIWDWKRVEAMDIEVEGCYHDDCKQAPGLGSRGVGWCLGRQGSYDHMGCPNSANTLRGATLLKSAVFFSKKGLVLSQLHLPILVCPLP